MPPRASLTTSFSVTDVNNEVVCPLKNNDGSSCRKRCTGEKRYRSMQEHIRRAHPEYYIPKLPATEESFSLMINSTPSERAPQPAPPTPSAPPAPSSSSFSFDHFNTTPLTSKGFGYDGSAYYGDESSAIIPPTSDLFRRGSFPAAANAAAALAQLHYMRPSTGWDTEQDALSETEGIGRRRTHFDSSAPHHALIRDAFLPTSHPSPPRPRDLLPSSLARSPPPRSSLGAAFRGHNPNRPRKLSVTENARKAKHERSASKDHTRGLSLDRKGNSAEPNSLAAFYGKRWEDLIEAAASATEGGSRDLTPMPGSPQIKHRDSLPPPAFNPNHFQSFTASPLQNALTPPPPDHDLPPFPSVESSIETTQSGTNFHMGSQGLSDSSPAYTQHVQIYCAACRRLSILKDSYACTECICGLCQECVDALVTEQGRGRIARCPRCGTVGSKFKPFQLDIR